MATPDKYRIEIIDYEPETPKEITLHGWHDPEEAADAGWSLLEAIAESRKLGIENQGDQYLAYYDGDHPDAGSGVITLKVANERTNKYYEL